VSHDPFFQNMILMFLYDHPLPRCIENQLLCERQRALYGIKCVLRIFWQTWLHILMDIKKNLYIVNTSRVTHSTNEELLNIKRKGDHKSRTLSRTSDTTEARKQCVIKAILLACSTYINIFKFIKSLLTYWQDFFSAF
jgi:hypothetical protein